MRRLLGIWALLLAGLAYGTQAAAADAPAAEQMSVPAPRKADQAVAKQSSTKHASSKHSASQQSTSQQSTRQQSTSQQATSKQSSAAKPQAASVRLQTDVITGSSELPKVLYIVPWRAASSASGLDAAPELSDQQLFQSLDPDAHGRLLHYRHLLGETVAEVK